MNRTDNKISLVIVAISAIILISCKGDEFKYPDKLEGKWNIVKSERVQIFPDGSTTKFEDLTDAGTLEIYEASPPAETLKEFSLTYTNFNGDQVVSNGTLYTDEDSRRVAFSRFLCDDIFDCDLVWTVDENKRKTQVWSSFGNEDAFFHPGDKYNPGDDAFHMRWTITLEKQ